ncbi:MAG TPA: DNA polymerase III subunit delta' [Candidatus Saccharicenans sp.]|jgi:DNA polymerase-3 subunit delta'|nr:DNA polymerase III subunit delta' [Candidatus Saccharicenans sp.]
MSFKDIAGNDQIKKILRLSLREDRLPNSLLFSGPPGVGKIATAMTVAKALNCQNLKEDACDRCDSCRRVDRGQHPNVRFITREKNREQIVKDQVDEINYFARLRPWKEGLLVFIIDQAERMNETVANSLLKTLEEPGPSVYFILITEDLSAILPTIRSRCQVLKFIRISEEDIERALEARGLPPDRAGLMASTTDGNLELALNLSWEEYKASRDRAWLLFTRLLQSGEAEDFLNLVSGGARKNSLDNFRETLSFFSVFFRDLLASKKGKTVPVLNSDLREELESLARKVPEYRAAEGVKQMEGYLGNLKKNPNLSIMSNELVIYFREIGYV